ncbi:MAG: hypothetical protein ACPGXX_21635 [Planctomycetaceae bacterium]|jgi:hypothetical protein
MSSLSRDAFLRPAAVEIVEVPAPEMGGSVYVRGMTARDRSRFETQFQLSSGKSSKKRMQEIRERLVVACVCDANGELLLTEADIEAVGKQPAPVIERIVEAAQAVCGMSNRDVEDIAKNSEETLPDS